MSRQVQITLVILVLGVVAGAVYLRGLHSQFLRLASPAETDAQAHRAVTQHPVASPSDVKARARIFWASSDKPGTLEPVEVELPLSASPAQRVRQILDTLLNPPHPALRTLPADTALLSFYLLADGTAVADFSDAVARSTPSGITSERLVVESVLRTLQANVPAALRLKILIHGQEPETLAGHLDLTGFFLLRVTDANTAPAAAGLTPPREPAKLSP